MAAPHVAGAAALLKQRHPAWTLAQIKSALVSTGDPGPAGRATRGGASAPEGGGRIDLPRADDPLVFAARPRLVRARRGGTTTATDRRRSRTRAAAPGPGGVAVAAAERRRPARPLALGAGRRPRASARVTAHRRRGRGRGRRHRLRRPHARLRRAARIPFWLHVEMPKLGTQKHAHAPRTRHLRRQHRRASRRSSRRTAIPRVRPAARRPADLAGRSRCSASRLRSRSRTSAWRSSARRRVSRVAAPRGGGDENRLVGYTALPVEPQPVPADFGRVVAGGRRRPAGARDATTSSSTRRRGATPGQVHVPRLGERRDAAEGPLLTRRSCRARRLRLGVTDAAPASTRARSLPRSTASPPGHVRAEGPGDDPDRRARARPHRVTFQVSDYQETKNMENVGPILPNTRTFSATFVVR